VTVVRVMCWPTVSAICWPSAYGQWPSTGRGADVVAPAGSDAGAVARVGAGTGRLAAVERGAAVLLGAAACPPPFPPLQPASAVASTTTPARRPRLRHMAEAYEPGERHEVDLPQVRCALTSP
jgi:hypothetical protein